MNVKKKQGRKPITGKYNTRNELIQNIHFYYYQTDQCQAQVARTCGVSEGVVASILAKHKQGKRL